MSKISRQILIGALTLILLSSACGAITTEATPTPVGTILAEGQTRPPQLTSTVISGKRQQAFRSHRSFRSPVKMLYPCSASSV